MKAGKVKYKLKEVGESLKGKSAKERHSIKVREFSKIKLKDFIKDGVEIVIIDGPKKKNGLLFVSVKARKNGEDIEVNNPLLFKNPPILVPDGNDFIEDLEEALKIIIVDTVEWQH